MTNIVLKKSEIYNIEPMALYGLTSVERLDLTENMIGTIRVNAFAGMDSLLYLDLSYMHYYGYLRVIEPYAFANLTQLISLNLTQNRLTTLRAFAFYGLVSVTELIITRSYIYNLEASAFNGLISLKTLTLTHNRIHTIPSHCFLGMYALEVIDLRFNNHWSSPLKVLKAYAFTNIPVVKTIYLDQCMVHTIGNHSLSGLGTVENIYLDNTELYVVEPFGFEDLVLVKLLDLSSNRLEYLNTDSFNGMTSLETLIIEWCRIHTVDFYAFRGIPQLNTLRLKRNRIVNVYNMSFAGKFHPPLLLSDSNLFCLFWLLLYTSQQPPSDSKLFWKFMACKLFNIDVEVTLEVFES